MVCEFTTVLTGSVSLLQLLKVCEFTTTLQNVTPASERHYGPWFGTECLCLKNVQCYSHLKITDSSFCNWYLWGFSDLFIIRVSTKGGFFKIIRSCFFSYFKPKTYVVTCNSNCLYETVLMWGHNICFY